MASSLGRLSTTLASAKGPFLTNRHVRATSGSAPIADINQGKLARQAARRSGQTGRVEMVFSKVQGRASRRETPELSRGSFQKRVAACFFRLSCRYHCRVILLCSGLLKLAQSRRNNQRKRENLIGHLLATASAPYS